MSAGVRIALIVLLLGSMLATLLLPSTGLAALGHNDPALLRTLLLEIRLPRTGLALLYGAMLGGAGAAIQALFANPLASPDITGATSGAALGAVVSGYLLGFTTPFGLAIGGSCGAVIALALLLGLAGKRGDSATLLLAGIAISALAGAATALALALAPSPFAFYDAYDWLMGSLVDRSLPQLAIVAFPVLIALAVLLRDVAALDALALGEPAAEAMGYRLDRLRRRVIMVSAIGVGTAVSVCGAVGFIGLVAPIFARRLVRGHPGRALYPAAIIGALLLSVADLLVRFAPAGRVLPVGVITALIGAPFFLWLVIRVRWEVRP